MLDNKKVSEVFGSGLKNEVQMIICTMDKENKPLPTIAVEAAKSYVIETFTKLFGGATITEAAGTWLASGQIEQEKNYVISSSADDSSLSIEKLELVKNLAKKIKELLQQDAVSVKINGTLFFI